MNKKNMTMKKLMIFAVVMTMLAAMVACSTPQSAINDLESLVEKVEKNRKEYTDEEWTTVLKEYSTINEELKANEYTDEELKEIGRLKGRYMGLLTKSAMKVAGSQLKTFFKQLEGGMEGLGEELGASSKELEGIAEGLEDEMEGLEEVMDDFADKLEEGLKGFIEAFDEEK